MGNLASFTTRFSFSWSGARIERTSYYDDGFAIFLAPVGYPLTDNNNGRGLTLFNRDSSNETKKVPVVTVEFDSFTSVQWDPPYPHLGFDLSFICSEQVLTREPFNGRTSVTTYAKISYDDVNKILSAIFSEEGNEDVNCKRISCIIDLTKELPEKVSVRIAAALGKSSSVIPFIRGASALAWRSKTSLAGKEAAAEWSSGEIVGSSRP